MIRLTREGVTAFLLFPHFSKQPLADLLALQPNMDIRLHIVAPLSRREKVFQELRRPVFSLLDRGPLSESCTYLSYESVRELAEQPHLAHLADTVLADTVLDDYAEDADN